MNFRTLAITGAGGYFARNVIAKLSECGHCRVLAFTSSPEKLVRDDDAVSVFSNADLEGVLAGNEIDAVVHFAFSRRFNPLPDIASSLDFSARVYRAAVAGRVRKVVNISSQSVYGSTPDFRDEATPVAPDSPYSMAKLASEVLLRGICDKMDWVNLRFDSIAQSQRLLPAFVRQALESHRIGLTGGNQQFSFIDIEDAVRAVVAYLKAEHAEAHVYNVGVNRCRYGLVELAECVKARVENAGLGKVSVSLEQKDIPLYAGLDSTLFMQDTGWRPEVTIDRTIDKMIWASNAHA